ncbi:hypothetical protein Q3G72_016789 [Acer saccharum]|nr:hypothetical protein Q3G72_016789 [Acer saccharum]
MESTSTQTIDSDESVRYLQVAGYDEHEFTDDDLSKDIDLCTSEVDKILEESFEGLPEIGDDAAEPYISMEFKSRDDAREFYAAYGRRTGFTVLPWRGSTKNLVSEDEKDQRIRELTIELNNERQRSKRQCAAYQEQLRMVLNFVEEHTDHLSDRVQDIVKNIRELEDEQQLEDSDGGYV